jgi:Domain of unknown function (DUF6431)
VLTGSVLIVGVLAGEVEPMLRAGLGPALGADLRSPCCGAPLAPWGRGYRRYVRRGAEVGTLQVARAVCRRCRGTHALLPSFLVARRRDLVGTIGAACELAAAGAGHRPIALRLSVPATTARGWLRRLRARAGDLGARLWALAQALGALAARPPPAPAALAALCDALRVAHGAAAERLGEAGLVDRWSLAALASGGRLLSNTNRP